MTSVSEAYSLMMDGASPLEPEVVPLAAAHGRVLRETITADRDLSPFDRVTYNRV